MIYQDFLLDGNGDLLIENGDFVVGPSDMQHIEDILESFAGSWKQYPALGVGLTRFLKSENGRNAISEIKQQLQSDGYVVGAVQVSNLNGKMKVVFPNGSLQRNT